MFFVEPVHDSKRTTLASITPHKRRLKSLIPRNNRAFPEDFFEAKENSIRDPLKISRIHSNAKDRHSPHQYDSSTSETYLLNHRRYSGSGANSAREKYPLPLKGPLTSRTNDRIIHESIHNNSRAFKKFKRGSLNAEKEIQSARETRSGFNNNDHSHNPRSFQIVRQSLGNRVIPKISVRPARPQAPRFSSNNSTNHSYNHEITDPVSITHELSFAEHNQFDELMSFRIDDDESQKKRTSLNCQDTPGFKLLESNFGSFKAFDQIELLKIVGIKLQNGTNTPKINSNDASYKKRLDFIQFTLSKPITSSDDLENKENIQVFAKKPPRAKPMYPNARPLPSLKKRIME